LIYVADLQLLSISITFTAYSATLCGRVKSTREMNSIS